MSYSKAAEKPKYPQPPTGLKGKPGKPKGSFEKEMIDKASKTTVDKGPDST